jgi:hypothetical protein
VVTGGHGLGASLFMIDLMPVGTNRRQRPPPIGCVSRLIGVGINR